MEVKVGLAAEYGQRRFDVSLDETDLARLMFQHEIAVQDGGHLPEEVVFQLLLLEAERYKLIQSPKFGESTESAMAELRANREEFATWLATAKGTTVEDEKKRLGLA